MNSIFSDSSLLIDEKLADIHVKKVILFFLFALVDEGAAIKASEKVIRRLKKRIKNTDQGYISDKKFSFDKVLIEESNALFIELTQNIINLYKRPIIGSNWLTSTNVDLSPWKQFHKESQLNEIDVLIWSRILHYSDEDIADGLKITVGTVRYRVAKALRRLGHLSDSGYTYGT